MYIRQYGNCRMVCHDNGHGEHPEGCPNYKTCPGAAIICGSRLTGNRENTAEVIRLVDFHYDSNRGTGWNTIIHPDDVDDFYEWGMPGEDDGDFGLSDEPSQSEIDEHVHGAENGSTWDKMWCDQNRVDYDEDEYWKYH